MEQEIWKVVDGYNGAYRVSNKGNFESCINMGNHKIDGIWRRKKLNKRKNGYYVVSLTKNGKTELLYIHRLVAKAFCDNPNGYNEIDHIDGNPRNNRVDNLRWCTAKQNQNYELARSNKIHVHTKLEGKSILQFTTDGNFVREWDSISSASRELGYTREGIRDCCRGKQNTAFGFIWKYKEDMA